MKEIKLKIAFDNGKESVKVVDDLVDGLHDLDARNAREVAEAIDSINKDGNLKNTAKDAQELKKILDNVDGDQLKQADEATKTLGADAEKTAGVYRDASGRMRDANGKFVSSAKEAKDSVESLGDEVEKTAKKFDSLKNAGDKFDSVGNKMKSFGQDLTVGVISKRKTIKRTGNLWKSVYKKKRFVG